ncbi:hypothetical protein RRG08_039397 [Elysia crispata]|uniref:Uncharacterized protein n=1 Tax=Elysia crispata TaxID=231223 RepID=A0AAE0XVG6_9GAST|nr:hypothetical protein RRG08_039397 [Elysia crispata]
MRTWKRVREDGNDQKWKDIDGSEETFTGKGKDGNAWRISSSINLPSFVELDRRISSVPSYVTKPRLSARCTL